MKKVLLMGGNQFVGKRMCELLLKKKFEVYILNRGTRKNPEGAKFIKCDRNDELALIKALADIKVDYIIDVSAYTKQQAQLLQQIMKGKFVQYILISSASVYNNIISYPVKEESSKGENEIWGTYAKDKYEAEKITVENSLNFNFKYTIFRPFYIYGAENNLDRESYIFSRLENDLPIFIPNDGNEIIQFGYIDDLCNGVIFSLGNEKFYNEDFNISGEEGLTIKKYIELCGKTAGKMPEIYFINLEKENLKARDWFPFRNVHLLGNIDKIKNTGFKIEYSFSRGIKEVYNSLKMNKKLNLPIYNEVEKRLYKKFRNNI